MVTVNHLPKDSALAREQATRAGHDLDWGLSELLLAACFDQLRFLVWIQSEDGAKGRNRPKPLARPGVKSDDESNRIGSDAIPLADMAALMAKRNPEQHN